MWFLRIHKFEGRKFVKSIKFIRFVKLIEDIVQCLAAALAAIDKATAKVNGCYELLEPKVQLYNFTN